MPNGFMYIYDYPGNHDGLSVHVPTDELQEQLIRHIIASWPERRQIVCALLVPMEILDTEYVSVVKRKLWVTMATRIGTKIPVSARLTWNIEPPQRAAIRAELTVTVLPALPNVETPTETMANTVNLFGNVPEIPWIDAMNADTSAPYPIDTPEKQDGDNRSNLQ